MALPPVYAFEWDEINAEHIAEHRIADFEVDQLLWNEHVVVPNRGRESRMFLIGTTNGGKILTVVLEPTRMPGTWRPITAWEATTEERRRMREI